MRRIGWAEGLCYLRLEFLVPWRRLRNQGMTQLLQSGEHRRQSDVDRLYNCAAA